MIKWGVSVDILYKDDDIIVCIKPPRVLSTDEPGGLPELIRQALGDPQADVRTVHRLDRVVSGVMVLARNKASASELSRQIREDLFIKEYLAVVHGAPGSSSGEFRDLLGRDKARKMTYVATGPGKDVREAVLEFALLGWEEGMSMVRIRLLTGRTHQIRVQFASRGMPLLGERKYAVLEDECEIALWSHKVGFTHPRTGLWVEFSQDPPKAFPWDRFQS